MKKYLAEFIGTMALVFFGCGTAVVTGGLAGGVPGSTLSDVAISLAFGLSIVLAAYAIGSVSGAHLNPSVSLAMLIAGKLSFSDCVGYVVSQVLGALAGSGILRILVASSNLNFATSGLGQNGYGALSALNLSLGGALLAEVVLTFFFVLVILGVTSSERTSHIAGIVIGLTLTLVHLIGIPLTGTSVNPARSLAPAIFVGGEALSQVWVFILAPLVGAAIAAFVYKALVENRRTA
jgi:aquaporin Z